MSAYRTFGPALAILALSAAAQAQENDLPKFAGTWTVTAAELGGAKAAELVGATFEFSKDTAKFSQKNAEGAIETDAHPFQVDAKSKRIILRQAMDPMNPPEDPKAGMQRGIYNFKDSGVMFLCLTEPDATAFPAKFVSHTDEADFLLLKLERAKTAAVTPRAPAR
jgi:uncharacterized protein (TIGR03067 family)